MEISHKKIRKIDVIVIGSSPVSLIEATYLAIQGNTVAIIDSADQIGGAWKMFDYGDVSNIDYGAHILNPLPKAYSFLKRMYGINMVKTEPQPILIVPRFKVVLRPSTVTPYFYLLLNILVDATLCLCNLQIKTTYYKVRGFFAQGKQLFKKLMELPNKKRVDFLYPQGGVTELLKKIEDKAIQSNVQIILETNIETLVVNKGLCRLITSEMIFIAKKVVISSGTKLDQFFVGSESFKTHYSPRKFFHIYLHVREFNQSHKNFSYIYVQNHKLIGRVNNITKFVSDKVNGDNTKKIMVLLTEGTNLNNIGISDVDEIINFLQAYNLLSKDAELLEFKKYKYVVNYMTKNTLEIYKNISNGVIDYLHTAGLSESLVRYNQKWESEFDKHKIY